jgi:hypothetical protein
VKESFDFKKLKHRIGFAVSDYKRKVAYFRNCTSRFGVSGVSWFFKTHTQRDSFVNALGILRKELDAEDVNLSSIEKTFSNFIIPEEDLGHVYWYTDAHNKLENFNEKLFDKSECDIKLLKLAMNELKFIGESDQFHRIYQLENIQKRVKKMYQALQQKILEQQSIEKKNIELEKDKQVAAMAKLGADKEASIAKAKMMESIKIKEKRLAIIEQKKCLIAEKETIELKIKEQNDKAEIDAKSAEVERQTRLQESYRELELKEKMKELPLEEMIEMVKHKIEKKQILTFIQLDQLSKLKTVIENKK